MTGPGTFPNFWNRGPKNGVTPTGDARLRMEPMKTSRAEEAVSGKGFVPVLAAFFTATEDEIGHFKHLKESGASIHMVIDPQTG